MVWSVQSLKSEAQGFGLSGALKGLEQGHDTVRVMVYNGELCDGGCTNWMDRGGRWEPSWRTISHPDRGDEGNGRDDGERTHPKDPQGSLSQKAQEAWREHQIWSPHLLYPQSEMLFLHLFILTLPFCPNATSSERLSWFKHPIKVEASVSPYHIPL